MTNSSTIKAYFCEMNKYFHTANNKALHPSNEFIIDSSLHKHFFFQTCSIQIRDSPSELFTHRYCLDGRIDSFDISKQLTFANVFVQEQK